MKITNIFGAAAIAAASIFVTTSSSNAALQTITDSGGDFILASPLSGVPTLDLNPFAIDTGIFDESSTSYIFLGAGDESGTLNFTTPGPSVFTIGNVNPELADGSNYTVATVTFTEDANPTNSIVVDLLNEADVLKSFAVVGDFTAAFNIDGGKGTDSFDFTINAVPLPAGLALLLGGLGILGFVGRRRQVAAA